MSAPFTDDRAELVRRLNEEHELLLAERRRAFQLQKELEAAYVNLTNAQQAASRLQNELLRERVKGCSACHARAIDDPRQNQMRHTCGAF